MNKWFVYGFVRFSVMLEILFILYRNIVRCCEIEN